MPRNNEIYHPVCFIFPDLDAADYDSLREDIKVQGVQYPILVYQGRVVDGRHRHKICEELKIACPEVEYEGDEAGLIPCIMSLNMRRRHLTIGQRATSAAKAMAMMKEQGLPIADGKASEQFAAQFGVSSRTVEHAARVQAEGVEEVQELVESGDVAVSDAAAVVSENAATQKKAAKKVKAGKAKTLTVAVHGAVADEAEEEEVDWLGELQQPYKDGIAALNKILREFKAISEDPKAGAHLPWSRLQTDLKNAKANLQEVQPFCQCPYCHGDGCKRCKDSGWVIKATYESFPKEIRA